MDRNKKLSIMASYHPVALRKESVDRNISLAGLIGVDARSLSARRAWIEIPRNEKNRNNKERG